MFHDRILKSRSTKLLRLPLAAIGVAVIAELITTNLAAAIPIPVPLPINSTLVVPVGSPQEILPTSPFLQRSQQNLNLIYNVRKTPNLTESYELKTIVDQIVNLATTKGLSKKPLSIILIDLNNNEVAGYQRDVPRYPASVIKLFWMTALYAQLEQGILPNKAVFEPYLHQMIGQSDNEASSVILDQITATQSWSKSKLNNSDFQRWLDRRNQVNYFFAGAGYNNININQKVFPIPYLNIQEPKGTDLQMRGDPKAPIRNKVTAQHAARLMYEIVNNQAVSPLASQAMVNWLTRDLNPTVWKNITEYFNPIRGFLGESLPSNTKLVSKAGWTSGSRNEVAFIATKDGKTGYILAIFADDRTYASNGKIFPAMSRLVFNQMSRRSSNR
jgi:hypothetical protein